MIRGERGLAVSVEASVVLPALVLFIGLLLTLARGVLAEQHVGAAAAAGARAASLERSVPAAQREARSAIEQALLQRDVACRHTAVDTDATGVARALGTQAAVTVSITCAVELADISLPFIPGTISVTAERASPVDPLRGK
ncbi:pilus assembly protein [Tessaracoccus sp. MC1865]|uniref:TadE/TadG family type IV pilus assembly protein n=1 Tax=unclassified Tessaracoccus TaxID=2635419 RepID=UPI001603B359|nr:MULTISPECIES: TadE/TadG family type IV pilus assembly protein [unclassified Tessaracoccus]MBB1484647.1 pilus assembly protein [Tessaracoccus sp. MC1865]MBB1509217.1 pilus assembly protein [Tessaracoccus sp. MC1756]QTO36404.1 pilus assembly protein [Tessaracoccus sp. MC1865]